MIVFPMTKTAKKDIEIYFAQNSKTEAAMAHSGEHKHYLFKYKDFLTDASPKLKSAITGLHTHKNPKWIMFHASGKRIVGKVLGKVDFDEAKSDFVENVRLYHGLGADMYHKLFHGGKEAEVKMAGLADVALAAMLGLVYGNVARSMPTLAAARISNPNIYDAALGAAVATTLNALHPQHGEEEQGLLLPGQSPGAVIPPPAWNLM